MSENEKPCCDIHEMLAELHALAALLIRKRVITAAEFVRQVEDEQRRIWKGPR